MITIPSLTSHWKYAKDEQDPESILIRVTVYNRGPDPATLHIIPQLWFPNSWSSPSKKPDKPSLVGFTHSEGEDTIKYVTAKHPDLGTTHLYCLASPPPVALEGYNNDTNLDNVEPEMMFTENNTNYFRLYGYSHVPPNESTYVKDAFHDHIVPSHAPPFPQGPHINPEQRGTKFGAHYTFTDVPGNGGCAVVRLKLTPNRSDADATIQDEELFDDLIEERRQEADEFYSLIISGPMSDDLRQIMRQSFAGILWTKQYYRFNQRVWANDTRRKVPRNKVRVVVLQMHIGSILFIIGMAEFRN